MPSARPARSVKPPAPSFKARSPPHEALREIQIADGSLPPNASTRKHVAGKIKVDLGDVVERAQIYGRTPDETRQEAEAGSPFCAALSTP